MNPALTPSTLKSLLFKNLLSGVKLNTPLRRCCLVIIAIFICALIVTSLHLTSSQEPKAQQGLDYIHSPKVDDLYFLDFRLLPGISADKLRPNEKYRLAKVADITGDVVTLVYGNFFYIRQRAIVKAIQYGQLRYPDYFEPRRYDFTIKELAAMKASGAVYMVKRPELNSLFGNQVSPSKPVYRSTAFIPGKKQNLSGLAFLKNTVQETHLQSAFKHFQASAKLGYAQGQVNLAQMYLNGQHVGQDRHQALFWFKRAALQSHKPAILKYAIVCKQVAECKIVDFYDELLAAGVNIKIRQLDFSLE